MMICELCDVPIERCTICFPGWHHIGPFEQGHRVMPVEEPEDLPLEMES